MAWLETLHRLIGFTTDLIQHLCILESIGLRKKSSKLSVLAKKRKMEFGSGWLILVFHPEESLTQITRAGLPSMPLLKKQKGCYIPSIMSMKTQSLVVLYPHASPTMFQKISESTLIISALVSSSLHPLNIQVSWSEMLRWQHMKYLREVLMGY